MTPAVVNAITSMAWGTMHTEVDGFSLPLNAKHTLSNVSDTGPNTASEGDIRRPVPVTGSGSLGRLSWFRGSDR